MKAVKSLSLSLLNLILFLALSSYGLAYAANRTLMDREFVAGHADRLDIARFLREEVSPPITQQVAQQLAQIIPGARERVAAAMDATITELDPWMKQRSKELVYAVHDYLTSSRQSLELTVSLEPLRETLGRNMRQAMLQAPEMTRVPAAQRDPMVDTMIQQLVQQVPASVDIARSLGPGFRTGLDDTRRWLGYFTLFYWGMLILVLASAAGAWLITGDTRAALRNLGTTFLTFGAFQYASIFVAKYFAGSQLSSFEGFPAVLRDWLPLFINDLVLPVEQFSIGIGVVGVVFLVLSFLAPRREAPAAATA